MTNENKQIDPLCWEWYYANNCDWGVEAESLQGPDGTLIHLEDDYPGYPECGRHLIMEMSQETANLIKAAPKLLDALESVLTDYKRRGLALPCELEEKVKSVIKLSKGK